MTGRNWITTIPSNHWRCTWSTIINGQRIIAEKKVFFFCYGSYRILELTCRSILPLHQRRENWFLFFAPFVLEPAKSSQGCWCNFQEIQVTWWHHFLDNGIQNMSLCLHSHNSLHHRSCILGCLTHHYICHHQPY